MKRTITFKLILMLLTASLLLSSTGLVAMLASAQEVVSTPDLTTESTKLETETTAEAATEPLTTAETPETTTSAPATTAVQETTASAPATTAVPETTTAAPGVSTEGGALNPAGAKVNTEGGKLNAAPQVDWTGTGTLGAPYLVPDLAHFLAMQDLINAENPNKYFKLTADINLAPIIASSFIGYQGFEACLVSCYPNGTSNQKLILDGDSHRIYGLSVSPAPAVPTCGIFGYLSPGSVLSNIAFESLNLTVNYSGAKVDGIVAVENAGLIEKCTFKDNTLTVGLGDGGTEETVLLGTHSVNVGYSATVGDNKGTVQDSTFTNITVTVNKRRFVGAVAGQNDYKIGASISGTGIYINGVKVTAAQSDGSMYLGGVTGRNLSGSEISKCRLNLPGTGTPINSFSFGDMVGGVAGINVGSISGCYVSGKVVSAGTIGPLTDTLDANRYDMYGYSGIFGGVAGSNTGTVSTTSAENIGMYFNGSISNAVYGGLAGINSGSISGCYASGKQRDFSSISALGYYTGGIIGTALTGTTVTNSYALVSLSPNAATAGSIIGNGGNMSMLSGCYWSSNVSGWPAVIALNGMDGNNVQRDVRVIKLQVGSALQTIYKTAFTHSWGASAVSISGLGTSAAFAADGSGNYTLTEDTDSIDLLPGVTDATTGKIFYKLVIDLPAGIGAETQAIVTQQFSIDVVNVTSSTGSAVVSLANPVVLMNAAEAGFLKTVNNGNYKLGTDITLPDTWATGSTNNGIKIFFGTLDGDNKRITSSDPIFSKIYGARDGTIQEPDTELNLKRGYIHDVNFYLTDAVNTGILGMVIGGTIKNVRLTGNSSAAFSAYSANTGAFINALQGNSYLYNCFTDVKVTVMSPSIGHIAGLIGNVNAQAATVDNCGSASQVISAYTGSAVASLIGGIDALVSPGIIKNCYTGGKVNTTGYYIAIGANSAGSAFISNLYWNAYEPFSNPDPQYRFSYEKPAADDTGTVMWQFIGGAYNFVSSQTSYIFLDLPADIRAFDTPQNMISSYFTFTVDTNKITVGTPTVVGATLRVPLTKATSDPITDEPLLVTHNPTGMKARVKLNDGLADDGNGNKLIQTPGDLYYLSLHQSDNLGALMSAGRNYKLAADIDMNAITNFIPIGTAAYPFRGTFFADTDIDGEPIYKISRLAVTGTDHVGLFGYAKEATIGDFILEGAQVNATGQYAGLVAAQVSGTTVENIHIRDYVQGGTTVSTSVASTYMGGGSNAWVGGVVGGVENTTLLTTTIQNLTVEDINVTNLVSGGVGGIAGNIAAAATCIISDITINDIIVNATPSIVGSGGVGGVIGHQFGNSTIKGIVMNGTSPGSCQISGTGFVGGIVGKSESPISNAKIYGCTLSGVTVANSSTVMTGSSSAATGGIAGWFSGTIAGDDPATIGVTETNKVMGCSITGGCAGGIVGRADTSTGNLALSISGCIVGLNGTTPTGVTALNPTGNYITGGIMGEYGNDATVTITGCIVRLGVTVTGGYKLGGILGSMSQSNALSYATISNCQTFATISTAAAASDAGGVIGNEANSVNNTHISGCAVGGSITAVRYAGGIVGYHSSTTAYIIAAPYIQNCYITAQISIASTYKGKIQGYAAGLSTYCFTSATIDDAVQGVAFSSFPQDIPAFGRTNLQGFSNAKYCYEDINKPSDTNPTYYQHSSATGYPVIGDVTEYTINANNLPSAAYTFLSGWTTAGYLQITSSAPTQIKVKGIRNTTTDTGLIAYYNNTSVTLFPSDTEPSGEDLVFRARIPVTVTGITFNWYGHSGNSTADPYPIRTVQDLDEMRNVPNLRGGVFDGYFIIENDLVFTEDDYTIGDFYNSGKYFIPIIGIGGVAFTGHLNGNTKTITNLKINNTNTAIAETALFRQTSTGAEIADLKIAGAAVTATGNTASTNTGILVATAADTTVSGVDISNSSVTSPATGTYTGGIAGYATGSVIKDTSVTGTTVTAATAGAAGGITGGFGGTIGNPFGTAGDIFVQNSVITAGIAGGVVGKNDSLNLDIKYATVTGGSIVSLGTGVTNYAAGGILGTAIGNGDYKTTINNSTVAVGTVVTATGTAGGAVGRFAVIPSSGTPVNLLEINNTSTQATVSATASTGIENSAGGVVGRLTIAPVVKISNGSAGGSVSALNNRGGVIGFIAGTDSAYAQNAASREINSLVSNYVVSCSISGSGQQTGVGLVLGYAAAVLFPNGTYLNDPFSNIKYSSYQYNTVLRYFIGNSVINTGTYTKSGMHYFIDFMYDLNKGFADGWTSGTYMGLRHDTGELPPDNITMDIVLGTSSLQMTPSNMLVPLVPGFPISIGDFSNFTDSQGINFKLVNVSSNIPNLLTYDPLTFTITSTGVEGVGYLIFEYENGLKIALNYIYFDINGSGTVGTPYQITKVSQLALIRFFPSRHYLQMNDIAFAAADFQPGGAYYNAGLLFEPLEKSGGSVYFKGTYDCNGGNHYKISGLKINRPATTGGATYVGLFSKIVNGASVKNIIIENAVITGGKYVGALAGSVEGSGPVIGTQQPIIQGVSVQGSAGVSSCTVTSAYTAGELSGEAPAGPAGAGGIVGLEKCNTVTQTAPNLLDCSVTSVTISTAVSGFSSAGGIAGFAQNLSNCDASNIVVNGYTNAAGIAGRTGVAPGTTSRAAISLCDVSGTSTITAASLTSPSAGGIMAYLGKQVRLSLDQNTVGSEVTVKCPGGSAGGIFGTSTITNITRTNFYLTFTKCQSYASVEGLKYAGGIAGSIEGAPNLANVTFTDCVGGGKAKVTDTSSNGAGGIAGAVSGSGMQAPTGAFIKDCIASVRITAATSTESYKGKLIGYCGTAALTGIPSGSYSSVFVNNFVSSYPQKIDLFGSSVMNGVVAALQNPYAVFTDLSDCRQTLLGGTTDTFMVKKVTDGVPAMTAIPIAIATYDSLIPVTSLFNAQVSVWNKDTSAPVELAAYSSGSRLPITTDNYYGLYISGVAVTTNAIVSGAFDSGIYKITVDPTGKEQGWLEISLDYGLKLAVPLLTFNILGTGSFNSPFQLETAEHLTIMYYLPDVYYEQIADINIQPSDYLAGGPLYNEEDPAGPWQGKGFKPIGYSENGSNEIYAGTPFTGSYDGQNHKITGLYSGNPAYSYIGMFGKVSGDGVLINIHIELAENTLTQIKGINGNRYVGGLAGYCDSTATVENCSVAYSNVAGNRYVGGLIGYSASSLSKCFTTCDVFAKGLVGYGTANYFGEAGGLIGEAGNAGFTARSIDNCFATGSIYSGNLHAGGLVGRVYLQTSDRVLNISNSFFAGDIKSAAEGSGNAAASILVGSGINQGIVNGSVLYVAGTNISRNAALLPFAETSLPGTKTYIYFDVTALGLTDTVQGIPRPTDLLTNGSLPGGFAGPAWSALSGSYPVLDMADSYSDAYAKIAALPLQINAKDAATPATAADGILYKAAFANTVAGAAITLTSSKIYTDSTPDYPAGYDPDLTGNGTDRATDLLFGSLTGSYEIYRNIFSSTVRIPNDNDLATLNAYNGEVWCDCASPVVTLTATIGGRAVSRSVKLPYENAANTFYIGTERQLRAFNTTAISGETTGKFSVFASAINNPIAVVMLTSDINLRGNEAATFEPVDNFFSGTFEGNHLSIKNMRINKTNNDVGFFGILKGAVSKSVAVNDLNFEDVWVTGVNNVAALAGTIDQYAVISNCSVSESVPESNSLVSGNTNVGGLVGKATGIGITIGNESRATVDVTGVNVAGGFIGTTTAQISNCFAKGAVNGSITAPSVLFAYGIGGFAGTVTGGSVTLSFATGNVSVSAFAPLIGIPGSIGVGGFAGTLKGSTTFNSCFASGTVTAENIKEIKMLSEGGGSLNFGVGGLTGVNESPIGYCYSSSSVSAKFDLPAEVYGQTSAKVAAGVGGVSGVALGYIYDAYSSGSVYRETTPDPADDIIYKTYFKNAVGGVIGTTTAEGTLPAGYAQIYFDYWNNSYPGLTTVGGFADNAGAYVTKLTTEEFIYHDAKLQLTGVYWSFNAGAYPSLKNLVRSTVKPYIRYPAVLSVVAVVPDERDTSARSGQGITMAITTPNSLTITEGGQSNTYNLEWNTVPGSEVGFIQTNIGTISTFVPIRTMNASQFLNLIVTVQDDPLTLDVDERTYGSRRFDRLCAEMLGTETKPYLLTNKSDLQHIAPSAIPTETGFDQYYNTWYSPITITGGICQNYQDKVFFKLLSDIDMQVDVSYTYTGGVLYANPPVKNTGTPADDNHYIGNLSPGGNPIVYKPGIMFSGVSFAGNDYIIRNFTSGREFLYGVSPTSDVRNVGFENINITASNPTASTAIVLNNAGMIDGCSVISGNISAASADKVAGLVANNYGTIQNSTVNANITGLSRVGGIAAVNEPYPYNPSIIGTITNSAYTGGTITVTQAADTDAFAGGLVGSNSGNISNCFTMGSVTAANGAFNIGGFVGINNASTGIISAAYSRTNVTGKRYIGGFAGTNAYHITDAWSAGKLVIQERTYQTSAFAGINTGILADTYADRSLSGKAVYEYTDEITSTDELVDMSCFTGSTAETVFTASTNTYPQLTAILALDDAYGVDEYVPQSTCLLIGNSEVSAATLNTMYTQYIDTIALGSANPLSEVPAAASWLTPVSWTTSNAAIISNTGTATALGGTAVLTAGATVTVDETNGKTFAVSMPITVTVGDQNPNFNGGNGSQASPYEIYYTRNFDPLSYYGPDPDTYYIMTNDLNYLNFCPPEPITLFKGTLDGGQHVIYDLTVDNNSGLFGVVDSGAEIKNLGLVGASVIPSLPLPANVGLLAGQVSGSLTAIINCYAIGTIDISSVAPVDIDVGGLVGFVSTYATIYGCVTAGKFINSSSPDATPANTVGGIAGCIDGATVTDSFSSAYVGGKDNRIGGIAGEAVNHAYVTNCTFAGMVMDTALASGLNDPAVATIGNMAGSYSEDTTIWGSYDKQITLIADGNAESKFTNELLTGSYYTVDTGLSGSSGKFLAGLQFATMPIKFLVGSAAGSTLSFSAISVPAAIGSDGIIFTEIPQRTTTPPPLKYYLTVVSGDPQIITLADEVDLADKYAGVQFNLSTQAGTQFAGTANEILRYTQPRLQRIIGVSYTMTNETAQTEYDSRTVAVQIKNTHTFAGEPVTYSSDDFTNAGAAPSLFEDILVSSGGIYAAGNLPEGYNYTITARDQNGVYLLGSAGAGVPLGSTAGEYGCYIPLNADTTSIVLHYSIVVEKPWGVFDFWDSLVEAFFT